MKYKDRRNETIVARVESEHEKFGTYTLVYETGPNEGKAFDITGATLKRWWTKVDDEVENEAEVNEKTEAEILNLDMNKINEPYPEPKKKKYIPKPDSVVEYEKKKRGRKYNENLPNFDTIVELLGSICSKINETSSYIKFNDNKTTLWRKSTCISVYAASEFAEKLVNVGFTSFPNKDKERPFGFKLDTKDDFDKFVLVVKGE